MVYGADTVIQRLQEVGARCPGQRRARRAVADGAGTAAERPTGPHGSPGPSTAGRPEQAAAAPVAAVLAAGPALPVGPGRGGHPAGGRTRTSRSPCPGRRRAAASTGQQRLRRSTGRALAEAGYAEVLSQPFSSAPTTTGCSCPPDDPRRRAPGIANPLNDDEPLLRTTLLPGLFRVLLRNIGRGFGDVGLFEAAGCSWRSRAARRWPRSCGSTAAPRPRRWPRWKRRCPASRAHRGRADRRPGTARLVGPGPAGELAGRHRGRPGRAAGQPGGASRSAPTRRSRGIRAGVPRCSSGPSTGSSGWPGTPGNCTPG